MVGHFDEAFYRNKRAALLSSIVLVAVSALSVHIESNANLYVFKIREINNTTIIILAFIICLYLNTSFFLHYFTEIPEWRRNPETGIQQVEELKNSIDQLREQVKTEEQNITKTRMDAHEALGSLDKKFSNLTPTEFAQQLETFTIKSLKVPLGPIYTTAFNQISSAIHKDPKTQHVVSTNLNWEDISKKVITEVSSRIVGIFKENYALMLETVHRYLEKTTEDVQKQITRVEEHEAQRIIRLTELMERLRKTEHQIRSWRTTMNLRLRVQYLWLPVTVFVGPVLYAVFSLARSA
jgi:predicted  nucleic acid-binding Zn-ribbon protein